MKNILIVDGADNCAYDIFATSDESFRILFPGDGQDVAFIDDICARVGSRARNAIFKKLWAKPVKKSKVDGIHGIIFYGLNAKKKFYPTKRDADLDGVGRAFRSADL